jgi:hypothetical protein
MAKRSVSLQKQKHEVSRYLRRVETQVHEFAAMVEASVSALTIHVRDDGVGEIWCPSRAAYQKMKPDAAPMGIIFRDGSFLIFHEIVRFGFPDSSAKTPSVFRSQYSYHSQRNKRRFYFRFDHHPSVGGAATHPLHHLHSAGWLNGERQFQDVPRYEVKETTLAQVFRLLLVSFPTIAQRS